MSTITSQSLGVPVVSPSDNGAPHPVSSMIDATETLYRFTADEYEQVYSDPGSDGYATCVIYRSGPHVPVVLDRTIVGQIAVDDILP